MAFQNLPDLGYKDDGPFGAFFAGINGGNANVASQLANAQAAENLQQSQFDNPLKSLENLYNAQLATAKSNDPNYIPWQLKGQMGQMMSQDASGRGKQATYDSDVAATIQDNANKLRSGQITQEQFDDTIRRIKALKDRSNAGDLSLGQIGFGMQSPQEQSWGSIGFPTAVSGKQGNEGRVTNNDITMPQSPITDQILDNLEGVESSHGANTYNPESGATGNFQFIPSTVEMLRKQGINFDPNDPKQARQAAKLYLEQLVNQNGGDVRKALAAYGGFVKTDPTEYVNKVLNGVDTKQTTSSSSNLFNRFAGGIPSSDAYHEGLSNILMDTPEFRQKLALGSLKTDSAEDIARMRANSAALSASKKMSEPKYNEQLAKHRDAIARVETRLAMQKPVSEDDYVEYRKAFNWIQEHNVTRQIANGRNFTGSPGLEQFGITRDPSPISQVQSAQPMPFTGTEQQQQQAAPVNNVVRYDNKGNRIP